MDTSSVMSARARSTSPALYASRNATSVATIRAWGAPTRKVNGDGDGVGVVAAPAAVADAADDDDGTDDADVGGAVEHAAVMMARASAARAVRTITSTRAECVKFPRA